MTRLRDDHGAPVVLGDAVGRGGEATIHAVPDRPSLLAKRYLRRPDRSIAAKLRWMVTHPLPVAVAARGHVAVAWPTDLLLDGSGEVVGILMPRVRGAVALIEVFNPRRRATVAPGWDARYLHRAARNLASAVAAVHAAGHVVGDLNESNVLVAPNALVSLIDADSFQIAGEDRGRPVVWPCPVGKPEYAAPELQGRSLAGVLRNPSQDAFALAVLIFQLLLEGSHPFRHRWLGSGEPPALEVSISRGWFPHAARPATSAPPPIAPPLLPVPFAALNPGLQTLFDRCFVAGHDDPSRRPSAEEWMAALVAAETDLRPCGRGHYVDAQAAGCPWCRGLVALPPSSPRPTTAPTNGNPSRRRDRRARVGSGPSQRPPATTTRRQLWPWLLGGGALWWLWQQANAPPPRQRSR